MVVVVVAMVCWGNDLLLIFWDMGFWILDFWIFGFLGFGFLDFSFFFF